MSDNDGDIGAFMAGFVIGGLVGAATALILAPQSGSETRNQLIDRGNELRRTGEQQIAEYRERAELAIDEARGRVQQSTSNVQERARIVLDEGKSRVEEAIEKGKERVGQTKDELADMTEEGKEIGEDAAT